MQWTKHAEEAISRVPFFVRKRVRKKVEEEAARNGCSKVRLEHVHACRQRFLNNMENEVKGYQVETCFGAEGCPNRAAMESDLVEKLEILLAKKGLRAFLKEKVKLPLKLHHEFRVSISDCPNACSRPQIVDVGLIGATRPEVGDESCTHCGSCVEICREGAIDLREREDSPAIDGEKCLCCGQCVRACPARTLEAAAIGYRILVGGKLGRHPRLGMELDGIYSPAEVLAEVENLIDHYMKHNKHGERFGDTLKGAPLTRS